MNEEPGVNCPLATDAVRFVELVFKPGTWERHGVPETGCRVRTEALRRLANNRACQIELLIHGLMDWLDVTDDPEPSLRILRQVLDRHYPDDGRAHERCQFGSKKGSKHIFDVARRMAAGSPIVAWQLREWVIALAAPSHEVGRMVVGAPAPITLRVAGSILNHSLTSFMLEPFDSFEGVRATSRKTGSCYKREAGQTALVDWYYHVGLTKRDDEPVEEDGLARLPRTEWLPPNQLAIQVAIAARYLP